MCLFSTATSAQVVGDRIGHWYNCHLTFGAISSLEEVVSALALKRSGSDNTWWSAVMLKIQTRHVSSFDYRKPQLQRLITLCF